MNFPVSNEVRLYAIILRNLVSGFPTAPYILQSCPLSQLIKVLNPCSIPVGRARHWG